MKIANSGLFYTGKLTQNQQIATSKDMMKDCQSEYKFCCLKNKLIDPNKNSKIIFLYFSFLKKKQINYFCSPSECAVQKNSIR